MIRKKDRKKAAAEATEDMEMVETGNEIPFFSLSISHKQAPIEIRKLFSFDKKEQQLFLLHACRETDVWGAVLVSTCNRTEVYFSGERTAALKMEQLLAGEKAADIRLLREYFRSFQGEKAVRHLFSVVSGLDSMVLGEDEILGQVRDAYNLSCEEGRTDYYINTVFQHALGCAKQIKTKTCLSKSSVSIATLSAWEAAHFQNKDMTVLLLGATGQMGSLIVKNLSGRKNLKLLAAARSRHLAESAGTAANISYEDRYRYLEEADVVISATTSPHYTLTFENCKKALKTEKPRLFLDIAVPCDIDPDIAGIKNVTLKNIDYFETLAREHNSRKKEGCEQAGDMIDAEYRETAKELLFHRFTPRLPALGEKLQGKNSLQLIYLLRDCADEEELKTLLQLLEKLLEEE
jgi:glutamyl-tRNA reductase